MDYRIIDSGSRGNAVIFNDVVMVDCGVPFKKVVPYLHQLQLVLLTHIHSDHFNRTTIKRLAAERPTLRWGCPWWLVGPLLSCGVGPVQIDMLKGDVENCYFGFVAITPFELEHDVPNCGYKLVFAYPVESAIYATDTCSLPDLDCLKGCDYYFIEANYRDTEELENRMRIKQEAGEYAHEKRVLDFHLSEKYATDYIVRNGKPSSQYVFLHEHKEK